MSPGDMINDKRTLRVWFFMNHPLLNRGGVYSKICMKGAGVCLLNRGIY